MWLRMWISTATLLQALSWPWIPLAGVGEVVLTAAGSSARQTDITRDKPVDAVIMAIVDIIDIDGEKRYVK